MAQFSNHPMTQRPNMSTFYLTTPLYYPNARPHVGSAYTTIVCDVIARYKRMCGYDVAFLTGTDEHGEKLQRAADAAGKSPSQFVAEKRQLFVDLWKKLGIQYDYFVYTDQPDHVTSVQRLLRLAQQHQRDGQEIIYKKRYEGRYCIWDERYVSDSTDPVNCDICGRPAELISEENYFFRLSAFEKPLLELYDRHLNDANFPAFVQPDFRRNEVISFVKGGLRDISVSRKRIKWGIPWPDDPEQVFYVWYDALTGYMTGIGYAGGENGNATFQKYWRNTRGSERSQKSEVGSQNTQSATPNAELRTPNSGEIVHMIGKDILRFHAVYWPAFIMAAYPDRPDMLPTTVFAHGWIYYEQDKMSKSKGNVVYPEPIVEALESFGAPGNDALRYYLLREAPFGHDTSFSYDALIQRYNSDLANDLGNLASRTLTLLQTRFGGNVPRPSASPRAKSDSERDALATSVGLDNEVDKHLNLFNFSGALDLISRDIANTNRYFTEAHPWANDDADEVADVLRHAAETLRKVAVLAYPIMPAAMARLWAQLGEKGSLTAIRREEPLSWEKFPEGATVGKPEPIFPRLDKAKTLAKLHELAEIDRERDQPKGVPVSSEQPSAVSNQPSAAAEPRTPNPESPSTSAEPQAPSPGPKITIDDFAKVELVAGQIVSAEAMPNAKKLLKLQVDIGSETRQVCAGIAEYYKPEDLVGMKIVLVANLEPRKLRGVESNGMVVAASVGPEGKPVLATFREDVPNGTRLK
jgi:methionyl-tRNA synthetase